jgi:hypothetical protein
MQRRFLLLIRNAIAIWPAPAGPIVDSRIRFTSARSTYNA